MCRPEAHEQHLHGRGSVARDGEELARQISVSPLVAVAQTNFSILHFNRLINLGQARRLSFDLEALRSQILGRVKINRKRYRSRDR